MTPFLKICACHCMYKNCMIKKKRNKNYKSQSQTSPEILYMLNNTLENIKRKLTCYLLFIKEKPRIQEIVISMATNSLHV